jgi:hypothetical protein
MLEDPDPRSPDRKLDAGSLAATPRPAYRERDNLGLANRNVPNSLDSVGLHKLC